MVGVIKDQLMARVDPDKYPDYLKLNGAVPMDFTGRPMNGYILVSPEGYDMDKDLEKWIQLCLDYNPRAKSTKKKSQEKKQKKYLYQ